MPDLDAATRARLDDAEKNIERLRGRVEWWINTATTTPPRIDMGDVIALLNAYDALRAAQEQAVEHAEILRSEFYREQAQRARLQWAQAQAAPVLAAAVDVDEIINAAYDEVPFSEQMRIESFPRP